MVENPFVLIQIKSYFLILLKFVIMAFTIRDSLEFPKYKNNKDKVSEKS